jgi:hypothetical protein
MADHVLNRQPAGRTGVWACQYGEQYEDHRRAPEALLRAAQQRAREENTTLRALIEAGLRAVLTEREQARPFVLRDASVDGDGLQPAFRDAGWRQVREAIYGRTG